MKERKYESLEHTADVMIRAYGNTIEECLENAAYGMFDQIADLSGVKPLKSFKFEIEGEDPAQLLVDFLSELLFIHDTKLVILSEFDVKYDRETLQVEAKGEPIDRKRHEIKRAIKAVSYHALEIDPEKGYAQVLFDA